jgi:hypothetical protein
MVERNFSSRKMWNEDIFEFQQRIFKNLDAYYSLKIEDRETADKILQWVASVVNDPGNTPRIILRTFEAALHRIRPDDTHYMTKQSNEREGD